MSKQDDFQQVISEADIDWLFCIELNTCHNFRQWVAAHIFPEAEKFEHDRAWRSVSNSEGESDVLWRIELAGKGHVICLIENKIKAAAQPDQYKRYVVRGEDYVKKGKCQQVYVVLLAPKKYSSIDSSAYPYRIRYEDIEAWFRARPDERSQYLAWIYETAIKKQGALAPIDEDMLQFQQSIWGLASSEFPHLRVSEPRNVSITQDWIYMKKHAGYQIIYKMYKKNGIYTYCVVDLELAGRGDNVECLKEQYSQALSSTGIVVEKASKSAVFRLQVPFVAPPHYDEEKVRAALQAASDLKAWWEKVKAD